MPNILTDLRIFHLVSLLYWSISGRDNLFSLPSRYRYPFIIAVVIVTYHLHNREYLKG